MAIAATVAPTKPITARQIPIPQVEHGYDQFESMVIETPAEFDALLNVIKSQKDWNNKADFIAAMKQAHVDFQTDAVVLVRYTLGSSSYKVAMLRTDVAGAELIIRLTRDSPGSGNRDMAYHCFALIFLKSSWQRVRIVKPDIDDEVLDLETK